MNARPIRIGSIDESFYLVVAELVRIVLGRSGAESTLHPGSHTDAYASIAEGSTDLCVAFWLPDGHAVPWRAVQHAVSELTTLYEGARFYWAVPDYSDPRIGSIADLVDTDLAGGFPRTIRGLSLDATITTASETALDAYGLRPLGFTVVPGAFAPWAAALADAIERRTPVVVPLWQPYYFNARYALRRLSDPKNVFGAANRVVLAVNTANRSHLSERSVSALERVDLTIRDVTDMDVAVNERGRSAEAAAREWADANGDRVASWFTPSP